MGSTMAVDRQVSRFDAIEDLPGVHADLTIQIGKAGAVRPLAI
jgi:hypothetical protein